MKSFLKNIKDCSKVRNSGACTNFLFINLLNLQLLAISLHFFCFSWQIYLPGSGSRRENGSTALDFLPPVFSWFSLIWVPYSYPHVLLHYSYDFNGYLHVQKTQLCHWHRWANHTLAKGNFKHILVVFFMIQLIWTLVRCLNLSMTPRSQGCFFIMTFRGIERKKYMWTHTGNLETNAKVFVGNCFGLGWAKIRFGVSKILEPD